MKWKDVNSQTCSVARALSDLGDRWTMLILRDAFLGATTFKEFLEGTGAARNILTGRLQHLTEAKILRKRQYQEKPPRYEYLLTPKGIDLMGVMLALVAWGDRWHSDGLGKPLTYRHHTCGKDFHAVAACSECGEQLSPFTMELRPGPAYDEADSLPEAWRNVSRPNKQT